MTGGSVRRGSRRWAALARSRLRENCALLAMALASVAVVYIVPDLPPLAAVAILIVLLMTALVARRSRSEPRLAAFAEQTAPSVRQTFSAASLAAAVADPLIVFDDKGFVALANSAAVSTFGDVSAGISLPLKFRTPEMQELIELMITGAVDTRTVDYAERVPIDRSFRVTATAVGHNSGLFVAVFKDQSEVRRIDRMRADFIANASHELRTPLASIAGFVETLRGPARNDAAARDQFLQIMQNQTVRMARLIDDLLSLSRLEMKAIAIDGTAVDIVNIVESVTDSLAPLATESGVVIENNLGREPIRVSGDRDELFQVFQNLLENACKYGRAGGRVVVSRVGPSDGSRDAEIGIEVRDFGPGIAQEHIPRITERFYRVDVGNSRAQKGTGLGLSIVKHIMTRHGGRLVVTSQLGEGAAFTAWFPAG